MFSLIKTFFIKTKDDDTPLDQVQPNLRSDGCHQQLTNNVNSSSFQLSLFKPKTLLEMLLIFF